MVDVVVAKVAMASQHTGREAKGENRTREKGEKGTKVAMASQHTGQEGERGGEQKGRNGNGREGRDGNDGNDGSWCFCSLLGSALFYYTLLYIGGQGGGARG